ncbi:unnamed protein product [Lymnaea stagnalis]|uniref:Repulsive guidance molecule A n=1 Tax=Lymnaea stagnalis TaxID=6523 RepID=A0AAV2HKP2_LYMST
MAKQDLDINGPGPHDNQAKCKALRTYKHCMHGIAQSCNGDLVYYTARNFIRQQMDENHCPNHGDTVSPEPNHTRGPKPVPAVCHFNSRGGSFRHCGLFGDPHLRTFYEEFQTCKVKGAWPLVSNDYLTVQVTNNPVEGTLDATATSKLTVIVKGNAECTSKDFQTYQAQSNSLPSTFDDGRVTVGPYNSLELVEVDPGRHIEIHIRYIKTVVVVRQIGRYFTFSINMPEELVNQSSYGQEQQLCVRGCPQSELINYQEFLATRKYSSPLSSVVHVDGSVRTVVPRSTAEQICRDAKLVDFYFDSCVFDLMATGDQNFTLSALSALQDVVKLQPSLAQSMDNRTTLDLYDKEYGTNGSGMHNLRTCGGCQLVIFVTLLVHFLCYR